MRDEQVGFRGKCLTKLDQAMRRHYALEPKLPPKSRGPISAVGKEVRMKREENSKRGE